MSFFVTLLFVLTALFLIGVVLIQQPKTAGGLFSGTGQSLLGTSGKSFWTKFTTILAGFFMVLCLLMAALPRFQQPKSSVTDIIEKQQQAAQAPAPAGAAAVKAVPNSQAPGNPAPQSVPVVSNNGVPAPSTAK
jgi:preprotein translocase subunit SecG